MPPKGITTYYGMHDRVIAERGPAKDHPCAHCGYYVPADNWAYDHSDRYERLSPEGFPWSLDVHRYIPLCLPCHYRFDRGR